MERGRRPCAGQGIVAVWSLLG